MEEFSNKNLCLSFDMAYHMAIIVWLARCQVRNGIIFHIGQKYPGFMEDVIEND